MLLALLGAAFIAAGFDIADTPPCKEVNAAIESDPGSTLANANECYDGPTARVTRTPKATIQRRVIA